MSIEDTYQKWVEQEEGSNVYERETQAIRAARELEEKARTQGFRYGLYIVLKDSGEFVVRAFDAANWREPPGQVGYVKFGKYKSGMPHGFVTDDYMPGGLFFRPLGG